MKRMPRKEVYCETCGSNQPMIEHEPRKDQLNPYPWYDIVCGTCHSIIATLQIVPDDKPVEPSKAIEQGKPHLGNEVYSQSDGEDDYMEGSQVRPLPAPPRCRGIQIESGRYTGCAYGYGDCPPYSGPCDCPVCNGSGIEGGNQPN